MDTVNTAARFQIAHRAEFTADWQDGNAYHVGDANGFDDLDAAKAASDNLDSTCGWDTIVVERDGRNKPRVVYG